ncbi:MAG: DUF1848 family protein, partial [Schwartzia sp.]|nr:DUF1848 family protein [Schwartzia sp. (in: firmicutes)]
MTLFSFFFCFGGFSYERHERNRREQARAAKEACPKEKRSGVTLQTCSEEIDLDRYGIGHGACIDGSLVERITGKPVKAGNASQAVLPVPLRRLPLRVDAQGTRDRGMCRICHT